MVSKMVVTPIKDSNISFLQSITPVRFLDSPKIKQGATANNICKSRLDVILKTLRDNYAKWQLAQKRGMALCTAIEAIKTRSIEAVAKGTNEQTTLYPKEVKPYCDKISIIVTIFEDITKNTKESLRQLEALNKMSNMSEEIFFRTWKLQEFIDFTTQLLRRYELEVSIKQHVISELPHCLKRADLVRWSTAWEYPLHVSSYIDLHFKFLNEELKIEKT